MLSGDSLVSQTVGGSHELDDAHHAETPAVRADEKQNGDGNEPELRPFSHGWNDPAFAAVRKAYLIPLIAGTVMTILVVLSVLSIYWGAFWKAPAHAHNLRIAVVDLDQGAIGHAVVATFTSPSVTGAKQQLSYDIVPSGTFTEVEDIIKHVTSEKTWAAIVVAQGATTRLQSAVQAADASYNGSLAISVFFESARNENAVPTYVLAQIQVALAQFSARFAVQHAQSLANSSGADLSRLLSTAPAVLTRPVDYNLRDLHPFDVPVAAAVDFVGLIYMLVIAFMLAMLNTISRISTGADRLLNLRWLIAVRIIAPLTIYFFVSWFYALISLAFQVPFSRFHGKGGFVIYWGISFFGMSALGLAVESLVTLTTDKFIPFFLILWIIVNVSVAFYPLELLPAIFQYGYVVPFYHIGRAVRAILFGTKNLLGLNFGVLIAWVFVSSCTIALFTTLVRRRDERRLIASTVKPDAPA